MSSLKIGPCEKCLFNCSYLKLDRLSAKIKCVEGDAVHINHNKLAAEAALSGVCLSCVGASMVIYPVMSTLVIIVGGVEFTETDFMIYLLRYIQIGTKRNDCVLFYMRDNKCSAL